MEGHFVPNVQNQYKDIAHMIEKDEKKHYCVKNRFCSHAKPRWRVEKGRNVLNKAKEDSKMFLFLISFLFFESHRRAVVAYVKGNRLGVFLGRILRVTRTEPLGGLSYYCLCYVLQFEQPQS